MNEVGGEVLPLIQSYTFFIDSALKCFMRHNVSLYSILLKEASEMMEKAINRKIRLISGSVKKRYGEDGWNRMDICSKL